MLFYSMRYMYPIKKVLVIKVTTWVGLGSGLAPGYYLVIVITCHESGCHSPHLLHHTTAAHHLWTASPIIHCTHTFPSTITPITHTAVTNHSLTLIVSPHLHLIHTHTYKQHTSMQTLRSLVLAPADISERYSSCYLLSLCLTPDCPTLEL